MSKPTPKPPVAVSIETQVLPLLHLARMAASLEAMLRGVNDNRRMLPQLNETLKNLGCLTDYGINVSDHVDAAILFASSLIEAHINGNLLEVGA